MLEQSISHKQCEPEHVAPKSQEFNPQVMGSAYLVDPGKIRILVLHTPIFFPSLIFFLHLRFRHPSKVAWDPSGQISHLSPENPGLHWHFPMYASHLPFSEPITEHPQSKQPKLV